MIEEEEEEEEEVMIFFRKYLMKNFMNSISENN
jgi:hypothetical protein